jgi:minor extracellular protease Epr
MKKIFVTLRGIVLVFGSMSAVFAKVDVANTKSKVVPNAASTKKETTTNSESTTKSGASSVKGNSSNTPASNKSLDVNSTKTNGKSNGNSNGKGKPDLEELVQFSNLVPVSEKGAKEKVILLFKKKVDKSIVTKNNGKVVREFKHIPAVSIEVPANALKGLRNNPNILAVETDQLVRVKAEVVDWGTARVQAPAAWESGLTGKGIKVGVIDTGIAAHPDLVIAGGVSFASYTTSYADDNGHGTHVAGIIGARDNEVGGVGVAPEASLYAVKVLSNNGSGYLSDVVAGVDWSITNRMDVINLSLGSSESSATLKAAVDQAYASGVVVVAAAGNSGTADGATNTVNYPAKYDSVVAVGATNGSDVRASFSSTGVEVEVAAPGVGITSTYLNGGYASLSGTSMASPAVAANVALLKQAYPGLSAGELRAKLVVSAMDLGSAGRDSFYGYGLIVAPVAAAVEPTPSPTPPPEVAPSPTPAPEPVTAVTSTSTTVSMNKATYTAKDKNVYATVRVVDQTGDAVVNAAVSTTITTPSGKVLEGVGDSDTNGQVTFYLTNSQIRTKGTYRVEVVTSYSGVIDSKAITSFIVK